MSLQDIYLLIISIILIAAPFVDWTSTFILHKAANRSDALVLKERANMATVLAVSNTISGFLALCRILAIVLGPTFIILLGISLVLSSVPNAYWLITYYKRLRTAK